MRGLVFDIETADLFNAERKNPADLTLSVVGIYSYPDERHQTHPTCLLYTSDAADE